MAITNMSKDDIVEEVWNGAKKLAGYAWQNRWYIVGALVVLHYSSNIADAVGAAAKLVDDKEKASPITVDFGTAGMLITSTMMAYRQYKTKPNIINIGIAAGVGAYVGKYLTEGVVIGAGAASTVVMNAVHAFQNRL